MILRMGDWRHYPGAIVDDTTKNTHFLKFTDLLRQLGVQHYYLTLALHDVRLLGVNPHDPNISHEMALLVIQECAINPWYFFRECVRVPADGTDGVPFKIDRGNFAMYWTFFNNIDAAVEFLRQHGKTIGMATLELWLLRFLEKSRTIHVTKGPKLREETIDTLKKLRDSLPFYLWVSHPDDPDNKESFSCLARGNKLITAIGQNDEMSANGVGRGLTAGRLFDDEGPFTRNIQHILPAAFGSGGAARKINESEGIPYGNVIATTPGDLDTPEGAYIYNLMTSGINWDERYIDIPTRQEVIRRIEKHATSEQSRIIFYIKFNHLQLGTTDEELYRMISNASGTPEKIKKDYGGEWASGGLGKPYTAQDAERMKRSRKVATHKELSKEGYMLDWFYEEHDISRKMDETRHIIGLDTSEAVGRDAIAFVLTNSETAEVAATHKVKESNIAGYAAWLAGFMIRYPNTVLIIERKSTGSAIVDAIILILQCTIPDLHRRLYSKISQEQPIACDLYKEWRRGSTGIPERYWDHFRKYIGFATDKNKRAKLYGEVLSNSLRLSAHLLNSQYLVDEILALVEKNGRIDHIKSGHDDTVIAWLLTMWFLLFGKNLSHYGVSNQRLIVRQRIGVDEGGQDEQEVLVKEEEQRLLVRQLESCMSELSTTNCPIEIANLRAKVRNLSSRLDTDIHSATSMQSLKELVERQRNF